MRGRGRTALLVALVGLWAAGLAEAQPGSGIVRPTSEPPSPSAKLGAELFEGNCSSCHGFAGQGISSPRPGSGGITGEGPPLRGVGAQAADLYLRAGFMPLSSIHDEPGTDRVLFSDKEIRSLVAFVASLGPGPGPGIPRVDPASGSISSGVLLFTEHCSGCHQEVARGGFVTGARVPPLQGLSATEIAEAVRVGPYEMPRFSSRQISEKDLNSIIRYVLSTDHPDNRGGWGIGNIGPIPEGLVTWWIAVPLVICACLAVGRRFRRE